MASKTVLSVAGICVLTVAGLLIAQPGGGRGPQAMGPGGPVGQWLDDLEQAYKAKDMDKIGALIDQMKQQRQRFQARRGQRDFGPPPGGMPGGMCGPGGPRGRFDSQRIENKPPIGKTGFEKGVLAVLDDMNRNQNRGMMNVPAVDGRLLRLLAEAMGAKHIVEIGTSNGYSGIWQCLALKATGGKLTTFEIDAGRAALARQNFAKAGVDDIVTLIEGDAHEKVTDLDGPIDIVFVDADKEGYLDYLNKLLPKVCPGGLVIAHNINAGQADPRYIEAITGNADLETVFYQQGGGVSVTMKKRLEK
ncbi:MAG: O-methyltransferase [Phycisphaerales bacterium]|nr:MAG: O-methyltransferase [Phycisphaerales bacterium]